MNGVIPKTVKLSHREIVPTYMYAKIAKIICTHKYMAYTVINPRTICSMFLKHCHIYQMQMVLSELYAQCCYVGYRFNVLMYSNVMLNHAQDLPFVEVTMYAKYKNLSNFCYLPLLL